MENPYILLLILLAAGMLLIGAEIFVPGAVLGTLGGIAFFGAVIVAFNISATLGFYTLFGVLILTVLTVVIWIKVFPKSEVGRKMTLSEDGKAFKATEAKPSLVGKQGTAYSGLRPAGYALIDGQRLDVVAEGGIIDKGQPVVVIKVEGNRVVVRKGGT